MKLFKPELDARTNAGQALRLVAAAMALGLLATALIFLTQVFSITSVIYLGVLAVVGASFVFAWIRSDPNKRAKDWYTRELSEAQRKVNIRHYEKNRAVNKILIIIGCTGVLMAIIFGMSAFAPVVIAMFTIGFITDRYWRRLRPCENVDDPHERLAARTAVKIRFHTESFWMLVLLGAALVLFWIVINVFGIMAPRWLELMLHVAMFGMLVAQIGAVSMIAGFNGHWVPAEAHCTACGYPYDMTAAPVLCSECGGVMCSDTIAHWRRKRNPRLIAIGGAYVAVGFLSFVSSTSANRPAVLARLPTAGLITRVTASYSLDSDAAWAELQTRMPLSAEHRERLLDAAVRMILNDPLSFVVLQGFEIWVADAITSSEHFIPRVQSLMNHARDQRTITRNSEWSDEAIAESIFLTEYSLIPAEIRQDIEQFAFEMAAQAERSSIAFPATRWLIERYIRDELTLASTPALFELLSRSETALSISQVVAADATEEARLLRLRLAVLQNPAARQTAATSIDNYLTPFIEGRFSEDEQQLVLDNLEHFSNLTYVLSRLTPIGPDQINRVHRLAIRALELDTNKYDSGLLYDTLAGGYIRGVLDPDLEPRLMALIASRPSMYTFRRLFAADPEQNQRLIMIGITLAENLKTEALSGHAKYFIEPYLNEEIDGETLTRLTRVLRRLSDRGFTIRPVHELVRHGRSADEDGLGASRLATLAVRAFAKMNERQRDSMPEILEWVEARRSAGKLTEGQIRMLDAALGPHE